MGGIYMKFKELGLLAVMVFSLLTACTTSHSAMNKQIATASKDATSATAGVADSESTGESSYGQAEGETERNVGSGQQSVTEDPQPQQEKQPSKEQTPEPEPAPPAAGAAAKPPEPAPQTGGPTPVPPPATPAPPPADAQTVYRSGDGSAKQVALTFDDGPDVRYTGQILDLLKKDNVKATFFLIGLNSQAHPEMVKRIAAEGHAIGNHTWDHADLPKLGANQVRSEIDQTTDVLNSILGFRPSLMRPPYGSLSPAVIAEINGMGYKVVNWSVDTRDWAGTPAATMLGNVEANTRPGSIILMHSAGGKGGKLDNTVAVLPQIIASLRAKGYTFATVPELLHVPPHL
jgi:peptidoglycan/xylan/chitin deacetylase (PgdA/CDA1 family)